MNIFLLENKNEMYAKELENIITDMMLAKKQNADRYIKKMKPIIDRMTSCNCDEIIIGEEREYVYGASVYLMDSSLIKISNIIAEPNIKIEEVVKEIIKTNLSFVIEIDPKILSYPNVPIKMENKNSTFNTDNFTPGEVTAILLHELGHVLGDSDFYATIKNSYRKAILAHEMKRAKDAKLEELEHYKKSEYTSHISSLYILSMIDNSHVRNKPTDEKESLADKFAIDCGYGKELESAITKFQRLYMDKRKLSDLSDAEALSFSQLVYSMTIRRTNILEILAAEEKRSVSKYFKKIIKSTRDKLNKAIKNIKEDGFNLELLNESFIDKFVSNPLKTAEFDLSEIQIYIAQIENNDDKQNVLYMIQKKIVQMESLKNKLDPKAHDYKYSLGLITNYSKKLKEMMKEVVNKDINRRYGVWVKYPKGYED